MGEDSTTLSAFEAVAPVPVEGGPPDPDRPHWGPLTGVGVWLFSYIFPGFIITAWFLIDRSLGNFPSTPEEIQEYILTPRVVLTSIIATAITHILTLGLCWLVITGGGRRPFLASLGWHWGGLSRSARFYLVFGVVVGMHALNIALIRILPEAETTPFSEMLKSSNAVRIAVAALAVLTAPIVEEMVYRGILYSSLRKRISATASVTLVTALFVIVHFAQYKGAWASLAGLTILSLVLTLIRAITKSIRPCVWIHLVYNAVGSAAILQGAFK
jgi:CAAX protease family protein